MKIMEYMGFYGVILHNIFTYLLRILNIIFR